MEKIDTQSPKRKWLGEVAEFLLITIATGAYAVGVNRILVPHAIVGGGLTGICEIIYFVTGMAVPIWFSSLVVNAALLIVAVLTVGWRFCIRTIYGVLCMTVWLWFVPIPKVPDMTDPFMGVVVGGMFVGVGLAVIYLNGGSTGGTDIIAMIVNKYKQMPIGRVLFLCDLVIIGGAYFLPEVRSVEKILFGLTYTFMATTAVDVVMNKTRQSVQFFIFSKHYREIANAILNKAHRGVTILDGEGGFSHQPMKIITTLAHRQDVNKIFQIVQEIDPEAFVSQTETSGVFGLGFDPIKKK